MVYTTALKPQNLKNKYKKQMEFLKFHFPQEPNDYFAFIPMYCRNMQYTYNQETMRKRRRGVYQSAGLNTRDIATLNPNSKTASEPEMNVLRRLSGIGTSSKDYYISANGMKNPRERKNSSLFRLYNVVVDIDCHSHEVDSNCLDMAIDSLLSAIEKEDGLVQPNTIVKTGRGVQLWYALNPASYKLKKAYSCVRADILSRLKTMIGDSDLLRPFFKIDPVASKNLVGIFRMPGSKNIVAGKTSTFQMIHANRLDLMLYMDEHAETELMPAKPRKRKTKEQKAKNTHVKISAFQKEVFLKERTALIEDLIRLRGKNDIGYRDTYALIYLSAYLTAGRPVVEAWSALMDMNRMLPHPLQENELTTYMSTCCRKRGYRFTTKTVLDRLDVTEKEREFLGVKACTNKKEARKLEVHQRKARRNRMILELASQGYSQRGIAERSGCSQATVCRVLRNRDTVEVEAVEASNVETIRTTTESTATTENDIKSTDEVDYASESEETDGKIDNASEKKSEEKNTHIIKEPARKVVNLLYMTPEERERYRQAWMKAHPYQNPRSSD